MAISLCMVVRNEAGRIGQAIMSAGGLWDELVVVDNGSTDKTVDEARKWGAVVVHGDPDADSMSVWRNLALEYATDWCVFLDADQEVSDPQSLRQFLEKLPSEVGGVHLLYHNIDGKMVSLAWHELRAFRPGLYRYKYREHEIPVAQKDTKETACSIVIRHYPRTREGKRDDQLRRLRLDVAEHPDEPHPRYFLARQHVHLGEHIEALKHFTEYLRLVGPTHDVCEAYGFMAVSCSALGNQDEAVAMLHKALGRQPQRRYWWVRLAELYRNMGQYNIALAYLRGAAELLPTSEQHAHPYYTSIYLYELMQACQLAQHAEGHRHG